MNRPILQRTHFEEFCNVAINRAPYFSTDRFLQPTQLTRLQRLVDEGAVYIPQALNLPQFATLQALLPRLLAHPASAAELDAALTDDDTLTFDYQLGLDELDSITRTRTGFAFADLTPEIQDAVLSLIASRDLTTRKLDLSLWLDDITLNTVAGVLQPE